MANVQEFQKEIFDEINNPENKIHLRVQKKQIVRDEYLDSIKKRCKKAGLSEEESADVVYLVDKALWGFGIIDELIQDDTISDIRLISEDNIRIKRHGKRMATDIKFSSEEEYKRYIEYITNRNATTMSITNAAQVFTDKDTCEKDILRFSLVSDLINTNDRPTLLIRKIPKKKKMLSDLIAENFCTANQAEYIKNRWKEGHGILVCGPNGSGKTTLTNAILEETPKEKSVVVIQESEELFCASHPEMLFRKVIHQRNGSGIYYGLKEHAKLALMESFDVFVIGEVKGDEAAELSYATYTGSQPMSTVHSNSAKEGYEKIIDYALDAQPNRSRGHFAKQLRTMDTVIFVKDYKVCEILELCDFEKRSGEFVFNEVVENQNEN